MLQLVTATQGGRERTLQGEQTKTESIKLLLTYTYIHLLDMRANHRIPHPQQKEQKKRNLTPNIQKF